MGKMPRYLVGWDRKLWTSFEGSSMQRYHMELKDNEYVTTGPNNATWSLGAAEEHLNSGRWVGLDSEDEVVALYVEAKLRDGGANV